MEGWSVYESRNQLRDKLLGPVRNFLDCVVWSGLTYPKCGQLLPAKAQIKRSLRRMWTFLPHGFYISLVSSFSLQLLMLHHIALLMSEHSYLGLPTWAEVQCFSRPPVPDWDSWGFESGWAVPSFSASPVGRQPLLSYQILSCRSPLNMYSSAGSVFLVDPHQ